MSEFLIAFLALSLFPTYLHMQNIFVLATYEGLELEKILTFVNQETEGRLLDVMRSAAQVSIQFCSLEIGRRR